MAGRGGSSWPATGDAASRRPAPFVFCLGRVGDSVLMAPALEWLRERYGVGCNVITWRSSHAIAPIYKGSGLVQDVYWLTDHRLPLYLSPLKWHFLRWLCRRPRSDVFFLTKRDALLEGVLSIFRRAEFEDKQLVMRTAWSRDQHESLSILQTVARSSEEVVWDGTAPAPIQPGLIDVTPDQDDEARRIVRTFDIQDAPFVLVQMGNRKTMNAFRSWQRASNKKYWPHAHWTRVIDGLLQADPARRVLLCGAWSEWSYLEEMRRSVPSERLVNLARDLPLGALKGLATRARALISVDTGTAHLAAAVGCPSVVLFGPNDPRQYQPLSLGNPVHCLARYECAEAERERRPNVRLISPDDVLEAAAPLLENDCNHGYLLSGPGRHGSSTPAGSRYGRAAA